jgi:hypothetical protein
MRSRHNAGMRDEWGPRRSLRHPLVARALADVAVFKFALRNPAAAAAGLREAAAVYQRALAAEEDPAVTLPPSLPPCSLLSM